MSNRGPDKDPFEEILRQFGQGGQKREPAPDDQPQTPRPGRGGGPARQTPQVNFRVPGGCLTLIVVFVLLFIFGPVLLNMAVDWQWFGSLGFQSIYGTILSTQVGIFAVGLVLSALILSINWFIALRIATPRQVFRGQQINLPGNTLRLIVIGAVVLMALILALAASGSWSTILQFFQHGPFNATDPLFHEDIGFYVFELPFWEFIRGWLLGLVVLTAIGAGAIYATRLDLFGSREGLKVDPRVSGHFALLGALFLVLIAVGYWFDRYDLLFSEHDKLYGASYTDEHARLLGYQILMVVALISAALLLINLRVKALVVLGGAFGVWILAMVLVGGLYPGIVQNFTVTPDEPNKEAPYITNNIAATRAAFGLDKFREQNFNVAPVLQPADVQNNRSVLDNIRLWDYRPLQDTFTQLQGLRQYYQFNALDIDRYKLSTGTEQQFMLGARELNIDGLSTQAHTWVNEHLFYTHGYGVVASPVNAIEGGGQPAFSVSNMPVESTDPALKIDQPRIYYGEVEDNYVFVRTNTEEFDYPGQASDIKGEPYAGTGGVPIGGYLNKLLFSTYLGDFTVLISDQIRDDSRVLFNRNFHDAVQKVAPFLLYDHDPYIVIADGKLYWIQDAYTVTDRYPYSKPYAEAYNYIRNSVKVVIDAYNGSMTFYVIDNTDPLVQTYRRIFPDLFKDGTTLPASLRSHLRYPEDLFNVQAQMYGNFHITDPKVFYNGDDRWVVPLGVKASDDSLPLEAYYTRMRIPDKEGDRYVLIAPFTPTQKQNMIAWMAGNSDDPDYGLVDVVKFPSSTGVIGPSQVEALIGQDTKISPQVTLWNQSGSRVTFGNLLVVPLGSSVLYLQPLFLQAAQNNAIPELKQVIAASSGRAAMAETLDEALTAMFAQRIGSNPVVVGTPGPGTPQPTTPPLGTGIVATAIPGAPCASTDPATLSASALTHYQRSQDALKAGDWATYGVEQQAMASDLQCLATATK